MERTRTRSPASRMVTPHIPLIGAHLSVAGGLENALYQAEEFGCDCVQIFVKNQRQWRAKPLTDDQVERFKAAKSATGVALVVVHGNYLLNLASPVERVREGSMNVLIDELTRCETLGVAYLVFHPGAHLSEVRSSKFEVQKQSPERQRRVVAPPLAGGASRSQSRDSEGAGAELPIADFQLPITAQSGISDAEREGINRIVKSIDEIHTKCAGFKSKLLLEVTAGQGSAIGYRFEHLAAILQEVKAPKRLGVCLDTCHLFAAGYDFRTPDQYENMMAELDRVIGVAQVKCIHTNDSKRELGSRVDRHEHIGKGKIGKRGFANFINDPRWHGIPMILETPKGADGRGVDFDKSNLKRLRSLIDDRRRRMAPE